MLLPLKHAYTRSKLVTDREAWRLLDIAGMDISTTKPLHDVLLPPEYHVRKRCKDVADPVCPLQNLFLAGALLCQAREHLEALHMKGEL